MPLSVINYRSEKKKVTKKKAALFHIAQLFEDHAAQYDYLKCPLCKRGRLCDIPHGGIVITKTTEDAYADCVGACVVVKCPKCSSKFIIYLQN